MSKEKKVPLKRIISNNLYALKILAGACPGKIPYVILTTVFSTGLGMTNLFFLRYAVNTAQTGGSYARAVLYLVILCVIQIVYLTMSKIVDAKLQPLFAYQINQKLKIMTLKKTSECELSCYEDPDFYNKYTMVMAHSVGRFDNVLGSVANHLSCIISFFTAGILACLIDPVILIFSLCPFLMAFITKKRKKVNYELDEKTNEQVRHKWYSIRTFYQAEYAKEMRLTNISEPILSRFKKACDDAAEVYRVYGFKIAVCWFFEMVLMRVFSEFAVLFYAAYQTLVTGNMLYGDTLVIVNTVREVYWSIDIIINGFMDYYEHSMFIDNFRYFLDYKPTVTRNEDGPAASYGDIELKNVTFRYKGSDTDVLKNVSLKIRAGEKIALVGHNGAGKTTLTKLLLRLYDPTSGEITMNGDDIRTLNLDSYRDTYATVLQDYRHFSMTVKENVLLRHEREGDDELVEDSLRRAGIWDRVLEMPNGVDSILDREFDETGTVLSGGQAQKISIAHVYAKGSPVVILDEPTSALDPIAEYEMYKNMMSVCEGKSVVFISHRMSSAVMADRIYLLEHGEVVESGTHRELMKRDGKYAELFRVQAQNYTKEATE